jgi:hypothetical protein
LEADEKLLEACKTIVKGYGSLKNFVREGAAARALPRPAQELAAKAASRER